MLLGAALAAGPLAGAERGAPGVLSLAGLSLAALALSLWWIRAIGLVLVGLSSEFLVRELVEHLPAGVAVAYGAGLLLLCELAAWAETLRRQALVERAVVVRRAAHLCAVGLLAAVASGVTLAGGDISPPSALLAGVAGAAAVAALLGFVWSLGRDAR